MTRSPELLEFYLVEATEYIDALEQVVTGGPQVDTNALLATARALRGSSAMAKVDAIAEVAQALEQVAIRGREPDFAWTPDVADSLRAAVVDLRFCVRGVRVWSDREQARADARVADLERFTARESRRPTPPSVESTTPVFVALQSAAIAAELDAFVAAPGNRRALDDAIGRTRTLRGIAGIADFPPLSDVAEGVEKSARSLMPDAPLDPAEVDLFRAAASLFRDAAAQLRGPAPYAANAAETSRFAQALAALDEPARRPTPPIVRIEQLFYGDQGPHVMARPTPPSLGPEQRLHEDLVSHSENLARILAEARRAGDPVVATRVRRELGAAARDIETLAASFGAHQLSAFFAESGEAGDLLSAGELDALDAACRVIHAPFTSLDDLERGIAVITRVRHVTPRFTPAVSPAPAPAPAPVAAPTPVAVAEPVREPASAPPAPRPAAVRAPTPTGRELRDLLQTGIEGFATLEAELAPPADAGAGEVVSIDHLVYRGPTALTRAIELRDAWRGRGTSEDDTLREILDLLDLARPE